MVQNGVKAAQPVRSERFSFVSFGPASSAGLFFGAAVTLWTRRGADYTDKLSGIAQAVRGLRADEALIDGEAVVFRPMGAATSEGC